MVRIAHFIRHGESLWNTLGKMQGQGELKKDLTIGEPGVVVGHNNSLLIDSSALTEKGRLQAQTLAEKIFTWLNGKTQVIFVSSDLIRCKETTEIIENFLKSKSIDVVVLYDKRLREADHGILSGLLEKEYRAMECFKNYKTLSAEEQFSKAMDPENGESYLLVAERAHDALLDYFSAYPEEDLYFVTHGGTMKAMYKKITGSNAPFSSEYAIGDQIKNCSVMKINIESSSIDFS